MVSQTERSTEYAVITFAGNCSVEFILNTHRIELQINVYRIRDTEAVDNTCVYRQRLTVRLCIVMSNTGSQVRDDFVYTVLVVSAKQGIQVEHYVTVEVHIVKALLVRTVFTLGTLYIIG